MTPAAGRATGLLAHGAADRGWGLGGANDSLRAESFEGPFATAAAARLTWRDGRLRVVIASAGHPGPVLLGSDGRVRLVPGGGVPLGVFAGPDLDIVRHRVSLAPKDLLFFYTDGLADARAAGRASFGDELPDRLAALAGLPPADLVAGLRHGLLEFCGGELIDSVSMLAIQPIEPPG